MLLPDSHLIMSWLALFRKCQPGNDYTMTLFSRVNVRHVSMSVANQGLVPRVYMTSLRYVGDREHQWTQNKALVFSFWTVHFHLRSDQKISSQVKFLFLSFSIAYWRQNTHIHTKSKLHAQTDTLCISVTYTQLIQCRSILYEWGHCLSSTKGWERIVGWFNNPVLTGHRRVGF